jgi:hypothetical protein
MAVFGQFIYAHRAKYCLIDWQHFLSILGDGVKPPVPAAVRDKQCSEASNRSQRHTLPSRRVKPSRRFLKPSCHRDIFSRSFA